jgi:hypothetical protein
MLPSELEKHHDKKDDARTHVELANAIRAQDGAAAGKEKRSPDYWHCALQKGVEPGLSLPERASGFSMGAETGRTAPK